MENKVATMCVNVLQPSRVVVCLLCVRDCVCMDVWSG